jgi:hypothetical protein
MSDQQISFAQQSANGLVFPEETKRIFFSPPVTNTEPLVFKILADPRYNGGTSLYRPVRTHYHIVNGNTYKHTCRSFFGDEPVEQNYFFELHRKLKSMEKNGLKGSVEYLKLEHLKRLFRGSDGGWVLYIVPNNPTIYAMRVGPQIINKLEGRKGTATAQEIPSCIKTMLASGLCPWDVSSPNCDKGWIVLSKTGEGMATEYFVNAAQTRKAIKDADGTEYTKDVPASYPVHSKFKGPMSINDLPKYDELEEKIAWSREEVAAFVRSNGNELPAKVLEQAAQQNSDSGNNSATNINGGFGAPVMSANDVLSGMSLPTGQLAPTAGLVSVQSETYGDIPF